jgi:glycosyltransferase involved in cell wall biosynthesis
VTTSGRSEDRPPTVAFDHTIFAAQRRGGVSRYFCELASNLSAGGIDVSVHAPIYVTDALRGRHANVRVAGAHVPVFPGVTVLGNAAASIWRGTQKADVVHATWYPARRPVGAKVFAITIHDMIAETYPTHVRDAARQSRLKAAAAGQADLVLCVSENTKQDVVRLLGIDERRIAVTPLASRIGSLPQAGFASNEPYLLYVGQRGGYKNFAALAQAFLSGSRLRNHFRLLCFGGGPLTAQERDWISRAPAAGPGSIQFLSGDDQLLAAVYRGAVAYVCTSLYEGFGLPVIEAMSCGCPVVASRSGSIPEVGGDAVEYVAAPTDEAFRELLESLLFDTERLADLTTRGLARSQLFTWRATAQGTLDAYVGALA